MCEAQGRGRDQGCVRLKGEGGTRGSRKKGEPGVCEAQGRGRDQVCVRLKGEGADHVCVRLNLEEEGGGAGVNVTVLYIVSTYM